MYSTYFLGQIIGIIFLVGGLSILFQKKVFVEVVNDIVSNRALLWMMGVISLLGGLLIVLTNNIWYGGFFPFVITLIGWIMILRGIFGMFASHETVSSWTHKLKVIKLSWLYAVIILLVGLYLTLGGFAGRPHVGMGGFNSHMYSNQEMGAPSNLSY